MIVQNAAYCKVCKTYIQSISIHDYQVCKCESCGHQWIARGDTPKVCPDCMSPYWATPVRELKEKTKKMTYDVFKEKIKKILDKNKKGLGWSEIRNIGNFEQKVPNNKWVRQMEKDIGLIRNKEGNKIIWRL